MLYTGYSTEHIILGSLIKASYNSVSHMHHYVKGINLSINLTICYSNFDWKSQAKPRKEKNPTMSVTVVRNIPDE